MRIFQLLPTGDIVASSPVMLTFTPSTASYDQCVNISIVDDHNLENTESFSVFLNTTDDYVKLDYADLTLYIEDNDCKSLMTSMVYGCHEGSCLSSIRLVVKVFM